MLADKSKRIFLDFVERLSLRKDQFGIEVNRKLKRERRPKARPSTNYQKGKLALSKIWLGSQANFASQFHVEMSVALKIRCSLLKVWASVVIFCTTPGMVS